MSLRICGNCLFWQYMTVCPKLGSKSDMLYYCEDYTEAIPEVRKI